MVANAWVRLPVEWIDKQGLRQLSWKHAGPGANTTAALMLLIAIAHNADQTSGECRFTYDDLCAATGVSRAKASAGLAMLKDLKIIEEGADRSRYRLSYFGPGHRWGKLPAKSMYSASEAIVPFTHFHLRQQIELDAMKLFLLFIARLERNSDRALIGYDKIEEYTGIHRARIYPATGVLINYRLIVTEKAASINDDRYIANAYRIVGLEPYNHRGTRGRSMITTEHQSDEGAVSNEPVD